MLTSPADELDESLAFSVVVPVYGNEGSLPDLLAQFARLVPEIGPLEVVFVVDGSPDRSFDYLERHLPEQPFRSRLLAHSRNFGALAATRTGFEHVRSRYSAVIAADLQEPPQLLIDFHRVLATDEIDIVVGVRGSRKDPWRTRLASRVFWGAYRRVVQREIPKGGVDIFGCNDAFRRQLVSLNEANSSLVGLIFWLGFRREMVAYDRLERQHGTSGWSLSRKIRYLTDSVFAFTDLPIRLLMMVGAFGVVASLLVSIVVLTARLAGAITVPGYAGTLIVLSLFSALNMFAVGLVGSYIWRAFENTKQRPGAVVMIDREIEGQVPSALAANAQ